MTDNLHPLLERFRASWEAHDISELTTLFSDDFRYVINGENRFPSKKELRNYWCKNKRRQLDLRIRMRPTVSAPDNNLSCLFTATFYHPIRLQFTIVSGEIRLVPTPDGRRIFELIESYSKNEYYQPLYSLKIAWERFFRPALSPVADLWNTFIAGLRVLLSRYLLIIALFGVGTIGYVNFLHEKLHWISDENVAFLKTYVTPYWFFIGFIIAQITPLLRRQLKGDLGSQEFSGGKDLQFMCNALEGAEAVYILSGDFSFIDSNASLESRLLDLAFAGKLFLISYKAKDKVVAEMQSKSSSNEILLKLQDDGHIYFGFPVRAKVTLVESAGHRRMIYRYRKEENGRTKSFMGFLHQSENTSALLSTLEQFMTIPLRKDDSAS